jgi:hypothetical protein
MALLTHGPIIAQPVYVTWTSEYARTSSTLNQVIATAGDGANGFYTIANTINTGGSQEATLIKADLEGQQVWDVSFTNAPDVAFSFAQALDVRADRIAVSSGLLLTNGFTNTQISILASDGTLLWSQRHAPSNLVHFSPGVIHSPPSGYVFIGGSAGEKAYLAAYHPNGNLLWHTEHAANGGIGASSTTNTCLALLSDPDGNSYLLTLARYWRGTTQEHRAFWSFTCNGSLRWNLDPSFDAFTLDPSGTVFGAYSGRLGTAVKLDANGNTVWTNQFGTGRNSTLQANSIQQVHPDPAGDGIICVGQYYNGKQWRYSAARINAEGNLLWDFINDPNQLNGSFQLVRDAAVDQQGFVSLAGNQSVFIIKPDGSFLAEIKPASPQIAAFGPLDYVCAATANSPSGDVVRLVRLTRFPAFSPSQFGVYEARPTESLPGLMLSIPTTNGLILQGEINTNLTEDLWSVIPQSWAGTSVITTITLSNAPPNAAFRIKAVLPDE